MFKKITTKPRFNRPIRDIRLQSKNYQKRLIKTT